MKGGIKIQNNDDYGNWGVNKYHPSGPRGIQLFPGFSLMELLVGGGLGVFFYFTSMLLPTGLFQIIYYIFGGIVAFWTIMPAKRNKHMRNWEVLLMLCRREKLGVYTEDTELMRQTMKEYRALRDKRAKEQADAEINHSKIY